MNPDHDMLADRLQGHVYKMSRWQYMEAQGHMDPELRWIVMESIVRYRQRPETFDNNRCYRPWDLIKVIISTVSGVLIERLAHNSRYIDLQATHNYVMKVYGNFKHVKFEIMEDIADLLLIYIVHDIVTQLHYHTRYQTHGN